jgi:hypothetical protein
MKMPIKLIEKSLSGDIERRAMTVRELISILQTLSHPDDPICAAYDCHCATGDITEVVRSEDNKEYEIIIN